MTRALTIDVPARSLALLAGALLLGCSNTVPVYKLYPGPERPDSRLATISLASGTAITINGFNISSVEYRLVALSPGTYQIGRGFIYAITESSDYTASGPAGECASMQIELDPGETYTATGAVFGRERGLRIARKKTGEVVWRCAVN